LPTATTSPFSPEESSHATIPRNLELYKITRNHQCKSMEELLELTFAWLGGRNPFKVESRSIYKLAV